MMNAQKKNYFGFSLKFSLVLFLCLLTRLIPLRAPNVEPILAATMPISKTSGAVAGLFFAIISILLYDVITHTLGVQTFFTVFAYAVVGWWAGYYFKSRASNSMNYVRFAIMGTLVFDALTGLTVGPIFFHQSFFQSLVGQIPFTAFHLLGNIIFAYTLSPAIYHFMIKKKNKKEIVSPIITLNPKII